MRIIKLVTALFITHISIISAAEDCSGVTWDGESETPIEISLIEPNAKPVQGAKIRIVKLDRKGDRTKKEWNTFIGLRSVEGSTDPNGKLTLNPVLARYGFDPSAVEEDFKVENCAPYEGFSGLENYIIIEKEGFHTFSAQLSELQIGSTGRFYSGEKVRGDLQVTLLRENI
ncbi:hypothetical protein [Microbulbifer hydrolyticus]|uniref:Uncharacterized protein n=1 Tax=Microbulbifer hydrolyticus TaxID=48074 RepID=A0A6P1TCD7_9GAMM|nr:hypothetical protein [Microbulbifer hydrolyticus]MBB5213100.1 hypothetical protein [Microbulbifer hydrolyticus]QHQ40454.1 hypothetical protein GTQ55_16715 [Microbulbifer hydrolyticus]